jgi:hypothetical protein
MPTYKWQCADGHVAERIFRMSDKPESIPCADCVLQMTQVPNWAPAPRPHRFGTNKYTHTRSEDPVRLHHYKCSAGHDTDEWFEDPPGKIPCEEEGCELEAKKTVGANVETFWLEVEREGGYWDRGLGVQIFSEHQRNQICKQKGLVPVDGDYDIAKEAKPYFDRIKEEDEAYNDYYDRTMRNKDVRKALDMGEMEPLMEPHR